MDDANNLPAAAAAPAPGKDCWTPPRCELREWLRRNAPSLAELYEGSVQMLFDTPMPGYTRFVAHSVREIRNRLPDALSGTTTGGRLDYKSRLDEIEVEWRRAGFADTASDKDTNLPEEVSLPVELRRLLSSLIANHRAAREKPLETAAKLFFGSVPESRQLVERIRPAIIQWLKITNWFMGRAHDSGATDGTFKLDELQGRFEVFEVTLLAIVRGRSTFFVTTDELDDILAETNIQSG